MIPVPYLAGVICITSLCTSVRDYVDNRYVHHANILDVQIKYRQQNKTTCSSIQPPSEITRSDSFREALGGYREYRGHYCSELTLTLSPFTLVNSTV